MTPQPERTESKQSENAHRRFSWNEAEGRGCTCEYGCRNCGYSLAQMGNCPAWNQCPVGRAPDPRCAVTVEANA